MRLILVNDVSIIRGGATKVALQCVDASRQAGLNCAILVGDDGEGLKPRFAGIRTVALGERPLRDGPTFTDVFEKHYNKRAYEALDGLLKETDEETVVHVHGWSQILSPSIFYALAKHKAKVIITAHDFFLSCPNGGLINFQSGTVCDVRPLSAACLATNCDKRNYLHKLWRFRRTLTQRGVGEEFWSRVGIVLAHESMEAYLHSGPLQHFLTLRTPTEPLTPTPVEAWRNHRTVFLGRMCWEKGVRTLADALNKTGRTATLIGRGPLLDEMQRALPHCWVPGWLADEEVTALAGEARVFIMPSRMPEPYGLVAAEALMSGIPVIVSSNALIAAEVERNGAGLVFKSGDAGSLAERLASTDDDRLMRSLCEGARALGQRIAPSKAEWGRRMVDIYTGRSGFFAQ
ncbi:MULTISPECIES: glycosyltransferase family 4 protein [unclassified Rhizobium]|uniref:glycosyltransferase family 4 protein n=1 Tax=unclassified Rhizobium TaxID=2613769 RepID=UPI000CDF3BB4|nr:MULTISPECIES: glycosyltransferase family 4 protein [Rhizobium]AVA22091.1 glycosyltransferase family 1 protein [Rhizobium sp. NXC24]MDK4737964.1 glycosyltransferase family 4 protein [Rhizobium sp. CNPSo 3464]UWU23143.1 glycosyltransferase family 4 protein [Rhizobium tropici]